MINAENSRLSRRRCFPENNNYILILSGPTVRCRGRDRKREQKTMQS